jgi:hypothetical protein
LSESDFYTPTDVDVLRMENELLAFEVRFLRASLGWSKGRPGSPATPARLSHLEEAEKDLVLLLRRVGSSPLGRLFRRSANYRTLEQRYLNPQAASSPSSPDHVAYLEGAERDLVLLLRRMGRGPLGALFHRRKSFRTLEQRYL